MNIGTIDQQSLDVLSPDRAETRRAAAPKPAAPKASSESAAEPAVQAELGLGKDIAGLGEAHTLDADRVAALIADPFGD